MADDITRSPEGPTCKAADVTPEQVSSWRPEQGFLTDEVYAFRVPRRCWSPEG